MTHELKTWPQYFTAVMSGKKTFEVRKADRDFSIGDILHLREYARTYYTGREYYVKVSYLLTGGQFGIEEGYVVMGITEIDQTP